MEKFIMTIEKWKYNYSIVKREFWIVLGVIFCFVVFLCFCNKTVEKTDFFDEAIEEYENNTGIKIYPYGRECLRKATTNCKSKDEVYQIIVQNEKWFKTK